jgi:hypothetical protein
MRREVFVSTDVEADGRIPGPNSMLSFASVAFAEDGTEVSSFSRNLELLEGASGDVDTMAWWRGQPDAWAACRRDLVAPALAMNDYAAWLEGLDGKPVFVGYPAAFDFLFVYWYLIRFAGRSPFSHSALDIKSYAMAVLGTRFHLASKRNMPRRWFPDLKHSHIALDDAREQGLLFLAMVQEHRAAMAERAAPKTPDR